jgi:hypothetical protein
MGAKDITFLDSGESGWGHHQAILWRRTSLSSMGCNMLQVHYILRKMFQNVASWKYSNKYSLHVQLGLYIYIYIRAEKLIKLLRIKAAQCSLGKCQDLETGTRLVSKKTFFTLD